MKLQSRKEKINLLNDLRNGKVLLTDMLQETIVLWFYDNGIYSASYNDKSLQLTEAEFQEYISKRSKQTNLIMKPCEGCEPIKE